MDDVDYEFWLKKENWSELEARFLLTGLTPFYDWKQSSLSDDFFYDKDEEEIEEIKEKFKEVAKGLVDAITYESIKEVSYQGDGILRQGHGWQAQLMDVLKITRYFNKAKLIKWAIHEGIKPPKELFNWYMKHQAQTTKEVSTLAIHPSSYFWGLVNDQDLAEQDLKAELELVKAENEALKKQLAEKQISHKTLTENKEKSYLNAISVFLKILTDKDKDAKKSFTSQNDVIKFIEERYNNLYGLSERNLKKIFSDANKTIKE